MKERCVVKFLSGDHLVFHMDLTGHYNHTAITIPNPFKGGLPTQIMRAGSSKYKNARFFFEVVETQTQA